MGLNLKKKNGTKVAENQHLVFGKVKHNFYPILQSSNA